MKTYVEQPGGFFTIDGLSIPDDMTNSDRIKMQAELDADPAEAEIEAYQAPTTAEQAASIKQAEALQYLASTDWYAIREAETGEKTPQEIKDARAQARIDASE